MQGTDFGQFQRGIGPVTPIPIIPSAALGASFDITAADDTYEDTGLSIELPTAGTYIIFYNVRVAIVQATGTLGFVSVKLRDDTLAADVSNSVRFVTVTHNDLGNQTQLESAYSVPYVVAGKTTIKLYAKSSLPLGGTWSTRQITSDSNGVTTLFATRI